MAVKGGQLPGLAGVAPGAPIGEAAAGQPLAERMRPRSLAEFVGQGHLLEPGRLLRELMDGGAPRSLLLFGPPGVGKTTLARLYAEALGAVFHPISAVMSGVKELREAVDGAKLRGAIEGRTTVLFVDEIHRFNKAQQDALLPHVEAGTITLVGATTENPSFEIIKPLHSRCRLLELRPLEIEELITVARRALADEERGLAPGGPEIEDAAVELLAHSAGGDARMALNILEVAADLAVAAARRGEPLTITVPIVEEARQRRAVLHDRNGDLHYQVTSAFIKSMRGSDPDAALFYLVRMLEAGEDPRFILRRMVIFASEDVGNADPQALQVAVAATQAYELVGLPEGVLPLSQAVAYLACAPKSNASFVAYGRARKDVLQYGDLEVPRHLVNAPTQLMKDLGYGRGYRYPHNYDGHYVWQDYRPERLQGRVYYEPSDQGFEQALRERLAKWRRGPKG